jgi:polyisoprenyl-phosphate glycosyltransferase
MTNQSGCVLSVVVPVYNEEENLPEFFRRAVPILQSVTTNYEIIFVLDPCRDRTEEILRAKAAEFPHIKLIKFSRRFGQAMAILAGCQYSSGQAVIVMDVDLQDPPELIPEMWREFKSGYDVVMLQRRARDGETWIRKTLASFGYAMINRIAEIEIPRNVGEFRLMSRRVVLELNRLKECHGFLRGLVAFIGFRQKLIQFDRPARHAGVTNYSALIPNLRNGLHGLVCFSSSLLKLSTTFGLFSAVGAFILAFVYAVVQILERPFPLGNPTIVILILFVGGIQLISIGIIGEYISRIYEEVRDRPKFIVDYALGVEESRKP